MNDAYGLSVGGGPSADDSAIVDRALNEFQQAKEPEAEAIFEGLLTNLARAASERYQQTQDDHWLSELAKLASATEMIEAENISAIVDSLLAEKEGLANLRSSRYFGLKKHYAPEPAIFQDVDVTGARLIATASRYRVTWRGNPIFEGFIDLIGVDGVVQDTFSFATGGGSLSHTITNGPCPPGRYTAAGFRHRNDMGFVVDGVGYSINLDERVGTVVHGRKYFRIHPDGPPFGTKGCIGIQGEEVVQRRAMNALQSMLSNADEGSVILAMRYLPN